ncbi:MAG: acyltransferase [Clostridia bacterium]|nr:acyltransferase [Clostridia bacterium]
MNHMQNNTKRFVHLDLLRLIAIYLVIFNHTGDRGFTLFVNEIESPISLLYMMASVFCKIAVPLFFMISGALLLKKDESLKQLFLKRVLRIVVVLILISIPYYYWLQRSNGIGLSDFFSWIYSNSASTSLWYLYSYLALLLILPFLRSMVKNMKKGDFLYLICGYLVFVGIFPCVEYLVFQKIGVLHESLSPVLFMTQNVFYALMGYYFEHIFEEADHYKRNLVIGIVLSIISVLITCFITYYQVWIEGISDTQQMERFFNCFIFIPTITVYCIIKNVGTKIKNVGICKWISVLGSAVFGVYLIEKFIRALSGIVYQLLAPFLGSFIASLVWCLAVLCLGLIFVVFLKHIPFIKKIVNRFI